MKWKRVNKSHQDTFYMPKSPTDASKWAFSWMLSVVSCCAWWHLSANFLHPEFLIESFSAFCLPTSQSIKTFSFFPPSIFDSRAISYPTLNCHLFNASNCYWKWKIEKTKARWERCCCCSSKKEFFSRRMKFYWIHVLFKNVRDTCEQLWAFFLFNPLSFATDDV